MVNRDLLKTIELNSEAFFFLYMAVIDSGFDCYVD